MLLRGHRAVLALAIAAAAVLSGCRYDGTGTKMQWAPDMADSSAPKPQRTFLDPPVGSVAMHATFYAKDSTEAETLMQMPESIASDPQAEAKGKVLYDTFCIACHGEDGKGKNAIAYLHYFIGNCDWYVTEKDIEGGVLQAFGFHLLDGNLDKGRFRYINISELLLVGAELDLHFTPKTLNEILSEFKTKEAA